MDKQTITNMKTDAKLLEGAIGLLAEAIERKDSIAVKENRARVTFWAKSIIKSARV